MNLGELLHDRRRLFWALNLGGWSGYVVAGYLGAMAYEKPNAYLQVILVSAVAGLALSVLMRAIYRRLWSRSPLAIAAGIIIISYLLAIPWRVLGNNLYWRWVKDGWEPEQLTGQLMGLMGSFYILLCWSGLYFGIKYYQMLQEQTEKTLKATAAAHQAQLQMLRYQLNPHFLFNTLNAISTLILDRANERANRTVMRLSDFLRHTLDERDPTQLVRLEDELRSLDLYLGIEAERFGERLRVERDVEGAALRALVPSLILQPLIENAIKYAVSQSETGGTIGIRAARRGDRLVLGVTDTGPGMRGAGGEKMASCGVGLRNVRERLEYLYGDRHRFSLAGNKPNGLVVTMEIPFATDG